MKKAIILAAGVGSRIRKYHKKPKALLEFGKNKITIVERLYNILKRKNFSNIIIVTGYNHNLIKKKLAGKTIKFIQIKNYKNTNNLQSLFFAKKELNSELLLFFSDLIFEEKIIDNIVDIKKNFVIAIDTSRILEGTMRIKKNKNEIIDIGNHISKRDGHGNFVGISKLTKKGAILLKKYLINEKKNKKDYYTILFKKIAADGFPINYYDCKNLFWKEIDTYKDFCDMKKFINNKRFEY